MKHSFAADLTAPRPHVVALEPSAFKATYGKRPKVAVAIGLRPISEEEAMTAMAEARKEAFQNGREGAAAEERYYESLMCWTLGFAMTDPNDARKPYWMGGDESVRVALNSATLTYLWDELNIATIAASPARAAATDDELDELAMLLEEPAPCAGLPEKRSRTVRKLAMYVLDELRSVAKADPADA